MKSSNTHNFWIIVPFLIFFGFLFSGCKESKPAELKVMSFNIWVGGGKSFTETISVCKLSNADIIGIQESNKNGINMASRIADSLGWYFYSNEKSPSIISRYIITDTSDTGNGVKIRIDENRYVWMFNVHLRYCPYQPYQLNGIEYCGAPLLSTSEEAYESALETRGEEVKKLIEEIRKVQQEGYPVFLTGDFNEPSCLDWTQRAVDAELCKTKIKWPSTLFLMKEIQLEDSYRKIYPDEVKNPGHTWTSLPDTDDFTEIHDRIDFVLYQGDKIEVVNSLIIGEESKKSDIPVKNYPSDHRAVISTFLIH